MLSRNKKITKEKYFYQNCLLQLVYRVHCPLCETSFAHKRYLTRHLAQQHSDIADLVTIPSLSDDRVSKMEEKGNYINKLTLKTIE